MSTVLPVLKRDVKLQLTNYRTSTYDVALVRIYNADLKRAACGWLEMQDAKIRHLRTFAQLYRAISLQH